MHLPTDPKIHEAKTDRIEDKIYNSTIIVGDSKTSLSIMNITNRQKINKKIEDLSNTTN